MEDLVFGKPMPAGVGLRGLRPALEQILADMARPVRELDLHRGSGRKPTFIWQSPAGEGRAGAVGRAGGGNPL